MKQIAKILTGIYIIVVLLELLFIFFRQDELRWISKPLLMPLLMIIFYIGAKKKTGALFYLILSALFLSWCGDILLQANLFIPGLVSFLLAHVCYIIYFKKAGTNKKGLLQTKPLFMVPVLLYIIFLLVMLFPFLGKLKIPVIVYSITIGVMLLMAINTRQQVNYNASNFFITGALLFVISDSLLAINLFAMQHLVLSLGVMATYATAQFLIIKGALSINLMK